jgi:hypothetical protein
MTITILRGSWWWWAQYSSKWYNNHNKKRWWFLFLWYSHTHVVIAKINSLCLKNNINNLNGNSIKLNINFITHNMMTKSIITDMSVLTKKSISRKAHENIRLMNHWNHCLLHNESLLMTWTFNTHAVYKTYLFILLWMESPSRATTWGTPHSPSFGVPLACRICKWSAGFAP